MGQTNSTSIDLTRNDCYLTPLLYRSNDDESDVVVDYTNYLPDACLANIFQFLNAGERKRCSLVCKRWLIVDGQNRHRLSLKAQAEIVPSLPVIFTRFDAVVKLALRCDRKSVSVNDDALVLVSLRCRNLTRLKLRGCREITGEGIEAVAKNCKRITKLSFGSCLFGATAMNAVVENCTELQELSIKRLRGNHDGANPIMPGAAAKTLRSICLKELMNGQSFEPLITGCSNLKTLKIIRCLGEWDSSLEMIGHCNSSLTEIHLERLQVSDIGLAAVSRCPNLETLHLIKTLDCSDYGLGRVAENCRKLRKIHIDGWRTDRIGDEGLIAVSKHCTELLELVLIGVNATYRSLSCISAKCLKLERFALCGGETIGDGEIECIATKCQALKKLCIKGCNITDRGIEAFAYGCPNLIKIKVKKCRGVSPKAVEWLQDQRGSLVVNFDSAEVEEVEPGEAGRVETIVVDTSGMLDGQENYGDASSSGTGRLSVLTTKLGIFANRGFVSCAFRRWTSGYGGSNGN
ncbi:hypothetical protein ACFE04_003492 [Oxalis oulophora]